MLYLDRKTATENAPEGLIDKFKADTRIEDLLTQYGYIKRSANEYQSPNSQSGHLTKISHDQNMVISLSNSDADIGRELNGSWCADVFDLFKYYECGNDIKVALEKLKLRYPLDRPMPVKVEPDFKPVGKLFTKLSEIDRTAPVPIIEDMLFARTFASITGASYSGKSFFALDAFLSIAAGIDYHGRFTKQGNVGLVIGEGQSGIYQRCEAWCSAKDIQIDQLPFYISNQPINMRDSELVKAIINEFKPLGQFQAVIIDTLARNFGGGNENAPSDMGEFIMACDEIINALDCSVVVVHHTGKDQSAGARGHSSFYGALETEISVEAKGDHDIVLTNTKQKDAKQFDPMQFVKIETLNSITLQPVEFVKGQGKSKLSMNNKLAFDTFVEAHKAKQATNGAEMACRLHLEEWRKLFLERHTGDNRKSKNTAFQRARTSLINMGLLKVEDYYYSYGDKATNGDKW